MSTKKNDTKNLPKLVPVEKLHFRSKNHGDTRRSERYCMPLGKIYGKELADEIGFSEADQMKLLKGLVHVIRCGYEPIIGTPEYGIKLNAILLKDYKSLSLTARVVGEMTKAISDMHSDCIGTVKRVIVADSEDPAKTKAYADKQTKKCESRLCVSPDKVVKCPECGTEFRVGKVLVGEKK